METIHFSKLKYPEMMKKLHFLYGEEQASSIYTKLLQLIEEYQEKISSEKTENWVNERDVMLITYGDTLRREGQAPLETLRYFLSEKLKGVVSAVHILPFYPFSSDDGFSVIDYFAVNPELGEWEHVEKLAEHFELMFDAVVNHISSQSDWFRGYLQGDERYRSYFVEADPHADYSTVTRPRALPLLTRYDTSSGERHIWTTFSEDQIDLNFEHPEVLLTMMELLLFYVHQGATFLRLDAIGYMWKKLGTSCIHLEETHCIVQLMRSVLETTAPHVKMITETNVPHKDNISYFGDGTNEAHLVYQFPLPPLTLHAFHTGKADRLTTWASSLKATSKQTTFFNFLSSHDGIGVVPAKGYLSEEEIATMASTIESHGGFVSYKNNGDGTQSPYELNVNYFDALSHPDDPQEIRIQRFLAAQGILLSLAGVPGIYIHSLLGSQNDNEGVKQTGRFRSINREKLDVSTVETELAQPNHLRHEVFHPFTNLIQLRRQLPAFHPNAEQYVLHGNPHVFSLLRKASNQEHVYVFINVSAQPQELEWRIDSPKETTTYVNVLDQTTYTSHQASITVTLKPYQIMWLKPC